MKCFEAAGCKSDSKIDPALPGGADSMDDNNVDRRNCVDIYVSYWQ
jgi:hypothetical protein